MVLGRGPNDTKVLARLETGVSVRGFGCLAMSQASTTGARPTTSRSRHEVPVTAPYRLDFTVRVLRRLSTNLVDVLTPHGRYVRVLGERSEPVIARVTQARPDALIVTLEGAERQRHAAFPLVRRMLGVDRDLARFDRAAQAIPWLKPLAVRMRGVRPARYPTLWEACVNAIVFQQVSLLAASAILRRMIVVVAPSLDVDGRSLYAFPTAEMVLGADDDLLRAAGLSSGKLATLRRVKASGRGLRPSSCSADWAVSMCFP